MHPGLDIEKARFNMVEQQVRTWDVLDQSVLDLLFIVKREQFVPPAYRALAFADILESFTSPMKSIFVLSAPPCLASSNSLPGIFSVTGTK